MRSLISIVGSLGFVILWFALLFLGLIVEVVKTIFLLPFVTLWTGALIVLKRKEGSR